MKEPKERNKLKLHYKVCVMMRCSSALSAFFFLQPNYKCYTRNKNEMEKNTRVRKKQSYIMYVECKKTKKNPKKKTNPKNMLMKCVEPQNIKRKKKRNETGNSVIMFSTLESVPPSWVPEKFFAKKWNISPTVLPVVSRQQE